MMGKLANVRRWASTFALDGSSVCARDSAALTYCSVWNMSTFQSKKRTISEEPRLGMVFNFSRTPAGDGFYIQQPRHAVHCLFERTGNGHHHLIDGHHAVVYCDQNSGEVSGWENRDGDSESEKSANQCKRDGQENNRS